MRERYSVSGPSLAGGVKKSCAGEEGRKLVDVYFCEYGFNLTVDLRQNGVATA